MKKILLSLMIAIPIFASAQVSNPEKTRTYLNKTGWSATVSSEELIGEPAPSGPIAAILDNDLTTYWHSQWQGGSGTFPYEIVVNLGSAKSVGGIYFVNRQGRSDRDAQNIEIYTSPDNSTWTKQITSTAQNIRTKQNFDFTATANSVQYIKLIILDGYNGSDICLADFGVYTISISDNTAWSRVGWTATGTNTQGSGGAGDYGGFEATIDNDNSTYWHSKWSVPAEGQVTPTNPLFLEYDMQSVLQFNKISLVNRAGNSQGFFNKFTVSYKENAGDAWTQIPTVFSSTLANPAKNNFNLGSTISARYIRLDITETSQANWYAMLAEFRVHWNQSYPMEASDNTSYDRTDWVITATDKDGNPDSFPGRGTGAIKDGDNGSWWEADYSKGGPTEIEPAKTFFPRTLLFDFGAVKQVNKFSYVQRNHVNSRIKTATLSYSTDGVTYTNMSAITWILNSNQNAILIGHTENIRYVKIVIAESVADGASVALAEFRAHYDQILPVELSNFQAKANGSSVNLSWATNSEHNASRFNVTRSIDGKKFNTIARVDAAGTSTSTKNYRFTDATPLAGVNYYQLQQIDYNGDSNASKVVSATIALNKGELVVKQVNANEVTLALSGVSATSGTITASNVLGQTLASQAVDFSNGNSFTVKTGAAKGLIIFTLSTTQGTLTKKIVK